MIIYLEIILVFFLLFLAFYIKNKMDRLNTYDILKSSEKKIFDNKQRRLITLTKYSLSISGMIAGLILGYTNQTPIINSIIGAVTGYTVGYFIYLIISLIIVKYTGKINI